MPLATAAFVDLRDFIRRRVLNARYRVGSTFYTVPVIDVTVRPDGVVRAQISIRPTGTVTITRVELLSNANELWAYQDVSITISTGQTGVLYWFDFTVKEGK